jgi:peptidoglycan-associated lipoprotein
MKLNKFTNILVIGLVLTIAASGCRKKPVGVTTIPGSKSGTPSDLPPGNLITSGDGATTGFNTPGAHSSNPAGSHEGWPEDRIILKSDTVYFDYDSSVIKTSEQPKVSAVADYMKANPSVAVRVEGNCDERGTEEYNRSLGERRALAVREELIRLGIDPGRVDTISFGKDKPAVIGTGEAVWKQNRRDEFVVLTPK